MEVKREKEMEEGEVRRRGIWRDPKLYQFTDMEKGNYL